MASAIVFLAGLVLGAALAAALARRHLGERERRRREAERLDPSTGLPNRLAFAEHLDALLAAPPPSGDAPGPAVFYLNLDRFRAVRESLGAETSDEVLRTVGEHLREVAGGDAFVAHLGGDEYAVLRPSGGGKKDLDAAAGRFLDAVRRPQLVKGRALVVTAGVGLSRHPDDGQDAETLLAGARAAMKRAKTEGRDVMRHLTSRLKSRALLQLDLDQELRNALSKGEFEIHYQPIVASGDRRVLGFEALLRWRHPLRGVISPGEFVELAEESGLLVPIGEWILKDACRALRAWRDAGHEELTMSVNVSARQIQSGALVSRVREALAESGLPPASLTLEITETVATSALPDLPSQLRELSALGVHLALDDFGTGFASLTDLTRLPVNEVKLDQSFVRDALTSPKAEAIARGVLALGASLRLEVVAEGVETESQAAFLAEFGCPRLQGYLFARPLPEEAVAAYLGERAIAS